MIKDLLKLFSVVLGLPIFAFVIVFVAVAVCEAVKNFN